MNTHPSRAWLLSLVLASAACASGTEEPGTEQVDPPVTAQQPAGNQGPGTPVPPSTDGKETNSAPLPPQDTTPSTTPPDEKPTETAPPEKVVLNLTWQRQINGYYCGPGTTRMVISTRESTNLPTQDALAQELGTDTNGTDHVGLMRDLLNSRWKLTGTDAYVVHEMDFTPTAAQQAQLKVDLVKRIAAGYGIVANVISGWRPPGYPTTGTYYHYVAVVGYDQNGDKALVADPAGEGGSGTAFQNVTRTYWINTSDLGTWIGGKGYAG